MLHRPDADYRLRGARALLDGANPNLKERAEQDERAYSHLLNEMRLDDVELIRWKITEYLGITDFEEIKPLSALEWVRFEKNKEKNDNINDFTFMLCAIAGRDVLREKCF